MKFWRIFIAIGLFAIEQNVVTLQPLKPPAQVAELVDAADSKSAVRKNVPVRVRPRALDFQGVEKAHESGPFLFANNLQTKNLIALPELTYPLFGVRKNEYGRKLQKP